jgi:Autophagocytosis associated protein, active-site domain
MVSWTSVDFNSAITRLSKLLHSFEEFKSWYICEGCLASKTIRHTSRHLLSKFDECLLSSNDSIITDCDAVYAGRFSHTEWRFSIAYSHIWNVPVMYFMVQLPDGTPCTRQDVLVMLLGFARNQDSATDMWDFVSSEEHPVTGVPSFFLHPCRTSSILETSIANTNCSTMWLLSWMSLIFPSVGLSISAKTFYSLQRQLKDSLHGV